MTEKSRQLSTPATYWFIGLLVVYHKMYKAKEKKYLSCHGEEAQEKPPGL